MANMAVFEIGPTGLAVAQPYEPGPAADALERRGPGPFQALYRTKSMGAAARWMQEHGLPPPARGVRNTGEQAMLCTPRTRAAPISASSDRYSAGCLKTEAPGLAPAGARSADAHRRILRLERAGLGRRAPPIVGRPPSHPAVVAQLGPLLS